jgi:hypothetical protein
LRMKRARLLFPLPQMTSALSCLPG